MPTSNYTIHTSKVNNNLSTTLHLRMVMFKNLIGKLCRLAWVDKGSTVTLRKLDLEGAYA